jgi:hypothetical protein
MEPIATGRFAPTNELAVTLDGSLPLLPRDVRRHGPVAGLALCWKH